MKYLYRYKPLDSVLQLGNSDFEIFEVIKKTPQGAWIYVQGNKKFVLLTAYKRYACSTKREAIESYIARKRRHLEILKVQVNWIIPLLKIAEEKLANFGYE